MNDTQRDKEIGTDRWLRQTLGNRPQAEGDPLQAATDECLDAEMMASWIDAGLSGDLLARTEAHVADCPRCLAIVAAMTRAEPVGAGLVAPERPPRRWLGWLVPLTAAAAAAVILFTVLPRDAVREQNLTVAPPQQSADSALKQEPVNEAVRLSELKDERKRANQAPVKQDKGQQRADLDRPALGRVAKEREGAAKPSAGADTQAAAGLRASEASATASAAPVAPATPERRDRQEFRAAAAPVLQIPSPDPKVRWRVSAAGAERTVDGGSTWTSVSTGLDAAITAGASPSPLVCWLVGRAGVVFVTNDGRTWQRVRFPELTDLSAVTATDALRATVTTADGRQFTTTDGGATWTPRLLQEIQTAPF